MAAAVVRYRPNATYRKPAASWNVNGKSLSFAGMSERIDLSPGLFAVQGRRFAAENLTKIFASTIMFRHK